MSQTPSRRQFLRTGLAAAASAPALFSNVHAKPAGANNRLRIAVAGLNSRGEAHIGGWLNEKNVEIAYLIDPDENVLAKRVAELEAKGHKVKGVADVRKALEDKELDAISIATPNHWHSLMTIWGAQAGKHVYVEKPMSHDIYEGRIAVEVAKKYGVVVQHGTQQRSDQERAGLHKAIKEGKFGRLKIAYGYCCKPRGGIGFKKPGAPPENLDWDLWKGPSVIDQYHGNLVHYNWHWFWKTGNGDLNNQGTHELDVAQWAIDDDQTHPVRAMAIGGRFKWEDQGETPNTMFAMAEYPNGQQVFFNVRNVDYKGYKREVQNEYYFENGGRILADRKYYAKGSDKGEKVSVDKGDVTPGGNWASFIAACRAGKPEMANGNALEAHRSCVVGHLMNNSYRLGEKVPFNLKAGRFGDNKEAAEHFAKLHEVMGKGVGIAEDGNQYNVGPWLTFDPDAERFTGDHAEAANKLLRDPKNAGFELPEIGKV